MKTKTRYLTLPLCFILIAIIISGCSFLGGTGSIFVNNQSICSNYSQIDMNKLPFALVDTMTDGYINKQKNAIDQAHTMNDARAVWFDLETLKQFIYQIERNAKNDTSNTLINELGIRIYYANYPRDSIWGKDEFGNELTPFLNDSIKSKYGGLHTIVMIPTIRKEGIEMDFDPTIPSTYINGMNELGNNPSQVIYALAPLGASTSQTSNSNGAQNHGNLYPPFGDSGMTF